MANFDIRIDSQGTLERVRRQLDGWPDGVGRAKKRALRKLMTWLKRKALQSAAQGAGVTQRALRALLRFSARGGSDGINIWIGTNPIAAHHLGSVRWTRRMSGARVGRRLFPHSWSWQHARSTAGLVMERRTDSRLPIDTVTIEVDSLIRRAIDALMPEIEQRYETLMMQELRYELLREQGAL